MTIAILLMFAIGIAQILFIITFGSPEGETVNIPLDDDNESFFYHDF